MKIVIDPLTIEAVRNATRFIPQTNLLLIAPKDQFLTLEREFASNYSGALHHNFRKILGVEYLGFTETSEGQAYLTDEATFAPVNPDYVKIPRNPSHE